MTADVRGGEWLDDNRASWDERVGAHLASDFYDQAPLRSGEGLRNADEPEAVRSA